jgi:hypothetical protein
MGREMHDGSCGESLADRYREDNLGTPDLDGEGGISSLRISQCIMAILIVLHLP